MKIKVYNVPPPLAGGGEGEGRFALIASGGFGKSNLQQAKNRPPVNTAGRFFNVKVPIDRRAVFSLHLTGELHLL